MQLEAKYKITTPMFIAGAEPKNSPEMRPPSFKGLLRFWFRALALSKLGNWEEVKKVEKEIFGSTENQSAFFLDLSIEKVTIPQKSFAGKHGLIYLGYGLMNYNGQPTRDYLESGGIVTLRLLLKKKKELEEAKFFLPLTLKALGLFGGAGARSRKGFGSLSLTSLSIDGENVWRIPTNKSELAERQKELFNTLGIKKGANNDLPEYTAFSSQTKVWIGETGNQAIELLNRIGFELLSYRSYGKEIKGNHVLPGGKKAEQNFAADHDLVLHFYNNGQIEKHPERVVFGLPHNYFFSSPVKSGTVKIQPNGKNSRRASPLFIHIHELGDNGYAAVLSLLPAQFLPGDTKVAISSKNRKSVEVACSVDYRIIERFMDRSAFSDKVVVWP